MIASVRPHMAVRAGVAARVQGLRRYYALVLADGGKARLVKELDGTAVLAEKDFPWQLDRTYRMGIEAEGNRLRASVDGETLFEVEDAVSPLTDGSVALLCEEGRVDSDGVSVRPIGREGN